MYSMIRKGLLLSICLLWLSCSSSKLHLIQKPIQFDSTRARLTLEYMKEHYGIIREKPTIEPKMVVVHWTAIPSFEKTFEVFDPVRLPSSRAYIQKASALNVSAHYLVAQNGTAAQLLPDTLMARHVIGLNYCAIGIENVGGSDHPLTDAQLQANAQLIRKLVKKYNIEYLIGHYEYEFFEGHPLWKELDEDYRTEKIDPGAVFMMRLRQKLKDLHLKGIPQTGG